MLRFLTAGESHGKGLVAILEGVPAGLTIDFDAITAQLRRRQGGYGRGRRMAIESDRAEALSGVRHGVSTGAPIALFIPNKDWENWQRTMYSEPEQPADASGADRPARLLCGATPDAHLQHDGRAGRQIDRASIAGGGEAVGDDLDNLHGIPHGSPESTQTHAENMFSLCRLGDLRG